MSCDTRTWAAWTEESLPEAACLPWDFIASVVAFFSQELYNLGFSDRLKHHKGSILIWFPLRLHIFVLKFQLSRRVIGINTYKHMYFLRDWCFEAYIVLPFPTLKRLLATISKFRQHWWAQLAPWCQSKIFIFKLLFWFWHQNASISKRISYIIWNEKVFSVEQEPKKMMIF